MDPGLVNFDLHPSNPSLIITGNTFPSTVFCLFGGFWLTFGATIVPSYGAYGTYSTNGNVAEGLDEPQFYATFAFFLAVMTILCAVFTIASIRTNVIFFAILLLLVPTCKSPPCVAVATLILIRDNSWVSFCLLFRRFKRP